MVGYKIPHSPACFPCSYSTTLSTKRKGYLCERCEVSALERFGGPLFWSIDSVSPVGQNLHHRVDVHHRLEGGRSWDQKTMRQHARHRHSAGGTGTESWPWRGGGHLHFSIGVATSVSASAALDLTILCLSPVR